MVSLSVFIFLFRVLKGFSVIRFFICTELLNVGLFAVFNAIVLSVKAFFFLLKSQKRKQFRCTPPKNFVKEPNRIKLQRLILLLQ
jgi:hypothetical protein